MQYFHRTSVPPDEVLAAADEYFGSQMETLATGRRSRRFSGVLGCLTLEVEAEGGHYTLITLDSDQVGESELDKIAKRFLGRVHQHSHRDHELRGAY